MRRLWAFLALPLTIAACSGGGGSPGPAPSISTSTPISGATPTPSPSATATPATASVAGQVFDYDSGAPIVGATVTIGNTSATTNASGAWTIANAPTDLQYFQVSASGYATYNSGLTVTAPMTSARTVKLIKPSSEEQATLAEMNSFRAQNGAGPLAFDEVAMEVSRQHAQDMANQGYFSHWDTNGLKPYQRYTADGGVAKSDENIVAGASNWAVAEAGFESEQNTDGVHFQTLIEPSANWAGLGEVEGITYDQEIVTILAVYDPKSVATAVAVGSSATYEFRNLSSPAPSYGNFGVDPIPTPLTPAQLNASPYNGDYNIPSPSGISASSRSGSTIVNITLTFSTQGSYYIGPVGGTFLGSLLEVQAH